MPLIAITRAHVRTWKFIPAFIWHSMLSAFQARSADGCLAVSTLAETYDTYWSRTIWKSEQDMRAYVKSGAHREASKWLADWCDEASGVHWTQDSAEPPTWEEAHKRMQQEGWPTKVDYPNAAQIAFQVPAPKVGLFSMKMRFK